MQANLNVIQVNPIYPMNLNEYDYVLPPDRIATYPHDQRDGSQLLIRKADGTMETDLFRNLWMHLPAACTMVMNDSRVIGARMLFYTSNGTKIEVFCLAPFEPENYQDSMESRQRCVWKCLIGNKKRFRESDLKMNLTVSGKSLQLYAEKYGVDNHADLIRFYWFNEDVTFKDIIESGGHTPLPPYIKRPDEALDRERYQTVYASNHGSVAAPTAGLHFTHQVISELAERGTDFIHVTLHVSAGTFLPIKNTDVTAHKMHSEYFTVEKNAIAKLMQTGNPVIAVGTTAARTLESLYWFGVRVIAGGEIPQMRPELGQWEWDTLPQHIPRKEALSGLINWLNEHKMNEFHGHTRLMIIPGYKFRVANILVTNFHQPKSTLLLLVSAFIGKSWKEVYTYALEHQFRFLSYGDSSILIPNT